MKNQITFSKYHEYEIVCGTGTVDLPCHTHKSFTVVLIVSGKLMVTLNGQEQELQEGRMIVLPPDNGISMTHLTEYAYISVSLYGSICERLKQAVSEAYAREDSNQEFRNLLQKISMQEDQEFLAGLEKLLIGQQKHCWKKKERNTIVQEAVSYMDDHVETDFTMELMARELNVSQAHLSRLFKREMHITPKQYMIQNRLRNVKKQIHDSEDEITIAVENGFAAESHLCTVFKRYMGVSISEYKKSITLSE